MGKRKRKNYQSLDEIQAQLSVDRMAADPLVQEALDYIANEGGSDKYIDAAMADAMEYLPRRRAELRELRAREEDVLQLAELRGGVPAPLVETLANGNEVRTHTRYAVNPVTGETEVIPFIDTATGRVLETEFGMLNHLRPMTQNRGRNVTETASELVGLHALKLMDEAPAQFSSGPSHYADTKVGDQKIDLMMVGRGGTYDDTMNIPRYTKIIKREDVNLRNEVNRLRRQGLTIEQAVSRLANQGVIEPVDSTSVGKLGRADVRNVDGDPDAVYDGLLVSGYDKDLLKDATDVRYGRGTSRTPALARAFATDKLALAPETLHKVDLGGLRDAIDSGEVRTNIFSNTNRGVRSTGALRDKIQEVIPQANNPYVTDVTLTHPLTAQLLRNMPII